jgi:hypothetical protein
MKCLYMVVRSLDPKDTGQERWMNRWKPALNAFAITLKAASSEPLRSQQPMTSQIGYTNDLTDPAPGAVADLRSSAMASSSSVTSVQPSLFFTATTARRLVGNSTTPVRSES